jgi:hypothetical protein
MMQQEKWISPYYWAAFTLQGEWKWYTALLLVSKYIALVGTPHRAHWSQLNVKQVVRQSDREWIPCLKAKVL